MLDYCRESGDDGFLSEMVPTLRAAVWFLTQQNFVDNAQPPTFPTAGLIATPGSLWIDPLKRGNYSTDTNAMAVRLFEQLGDAEAFLGNASGARAARAVAQTLVQNVNARLWLNGSDHYITQVNADNTTVDMVRCSFLLFASILLFAHHLFCLLIKVDYDANLIAVACVDSF